MGERKDYKDKLIEKGRMNEGNFKKRGQVAIFVIIALVIVGIVIVFLAVPKLRPAFISGELNPGDYLRTCISPIIKSNVENLSRHGGDFNPEGFILYKDEKIKYLCYTSQYYQTCTNQMPLLKAHFELELGKALDKRAKDCVASLKQEYESRGYSVSSGGVKTDVSISPKKIEILFSTPMTVTKEESKTYKSFNVEYNSEIYDLLLISQSIVEFESTLGDMDIESYMQYYPNLRIEKIRLSDGSKIYKVGDVVTGETITFATRSLAWPAGYGLV